MHVTDQDHLLLFIEPVNPPSGEPVIDELTDKMADALRWAKNGIVVRGRVVPGGYRGVHTCSCGVQSSNQDHLLLIQDPARVTNSLATHYLAWHREEIPASELAKVAQLKPTFSFHLKLEDTLPPRHVTI